MTQVKKIAAGVAAALALGYGAAATAAIPNGTGVADGFLLISDFTLLSGGNGAGKNTLAPLPIGAGVTLNAVATNADIATSLNGVALPTLSTSVGLGVPFAITQSLGAGFTPYSLITGNPTGVWAGGATSSSGNALDPFTPQVDPLCPATVGDCVPVHTQVSLMGDGIGSVQSNQNLLTRFTLTVAGGPQTFELNFLADGFLRAALGQDLVSANAAYNWNASVRAADAATRAALGVQTALLWNPDGVAGNATCSGTGVSCTEYSDAFTLNNNVGALGEDDQVIDEALGRFEIELTLPVGVYTFTINHNTSADAEIVPEPGTLALLGLGLFGLAAGQRRLRTKK